MAKHHPHHPHPPKHPKLSRAALRQGRAHEVKTEAMRAENASIVSERLAEWHEENNPLPPCDETPISPFMVPMQVIAQFDSPRRAANGKQYEHQAIDCVPLEKTDKPVDIIASISGHVLFSGNYDLDSGYAVIVVGKDGRIYSYAHLEPGSAQVSAGDELQQGDAIGTMGRSGNAAEMACLHFRVREPKPLPAATHKRPPHPATPSLASYRTVWPSIDGVKLKNQMVVQPSVNDKVATSDATSLLDTSTLEGMRQIAPRELPVTDIVLTPEQFPMPTLPPMEARPKPFQDTPVGRPSRTRNSN